MRNRLSAIKIKNHKNPILRPYHLASVRVCVCVQQRAALVELLRSLCIVINIIDGGELEANVET